ncbi:DUF58 domain-containing protein [Flavobacteriaceae bacterium 14752]|uniref:DUF58 domain-containing protein n=1 Tax=Mesohalobacter salilacus TaxID=2491711 RepID=UPI000F635C5D|nr:DUF58 domain-containing protein [Flavobacteriaceae bacterium 14752]
MFKLLKPLYFTRRFFSALISIALLFFLSYWFTVLFTIAAMLFYALLVLVIIDIAALFRVKGFFAERLLPDKFSNSDDNVVMLNFENGYNFKIQFQVIDEIPVQFQKRDFLKTLQVDAKKQKSYDYQLKPTQRGEYYFGNLNCYVSSPFNLTKRRYKFQNEQMVKVYPSFIQMKKYDFLALDRQSRDFGMKKIRRIGHSMEFEQIKEYVKGDDIRDINWKSTAKHNQLMVNQFQDEKSQPIYNIIDKGRVMKMPFEQLSLLDYAINSALAFSNIALKKNDKVGMLTYSNTIDNFRKAQSRLSQINVLSEALYNIKTDFKVSDFGLLYAHLKRKVTQRSLIFLFTNFEHISALERQLPYLKAISRQHVLVVIFFENTELDQLIHTETEDLQSIYQKTIATDFAYNKRLMVKELEKNSIQAILTKPKNLSINTINKYLEIKARGLL